jgi:two-component SAPR family response regulator
LRVILVDDEQPSLDELTYLLSRQADVEIAGVYLNPLEALEAVSQSPPDAMFLDLYMPRLSGVELALKVRELSADICIIFVTAYARELAGIRDMPAAGSLLKPVSEAKLSVLLAGLRDGLSKRRANGKNMEIISGKAGC